jgi:hypothetical protein
MDLSADRRTTDEFYYSLKRGPWQRYGSSRYGCFFLQNSQTKIGKPVMTASSFLPPPVTIVDRFQFLLPFLAGDMLSLKKRFIAKNTHKTCRLDTH